MCILIIGGSGFLGRQLTQALIQSDDDVIVKTRNPSKTKKIFAKMDCEPQIIESFDEISTTVYKIKSIVSLTGASVLDKRWTAESKQTLIESRTKPLEELKAWLEKNNIAIDKLLIGSAIGFYGFSDDPDQEFDERSSHFEHFTHELCNEIEESSQQLDRLAESIVQLRTGVVLGKSGGALQKMATPAKLHLNGQIGDGKQWVSWIHMQDWIDAVLYILSLDSPRQHYNLTSPNPVSNKKLSQSIASSLGKSFQLAVPTFSLKFLMGEASDLLIKSQKVMPANLQAANFKFSYPDIETACENLLKK